MMKPTKIIPATVTLILALYCSSCGPQRRIEANMPRNEEPGLAQGRILFKNNCQKCHPDGESGVGPPISNVHLPGFLTRYRIRSRSFLLWTGRMPAFKKNEISAKEMDLLIAYIKHLRRSEDRATAQK